MSARRIVIGYDGSQGAERALRWGLVEAARTGGDVEVVYAVAWPDYLPAASMVPGPPVWPDLSAESAAEGMLETVAGQVRAQFRHVPVTAVVRRGAAAQILCDRSREAALVVVGGRSHGAFAEVLLGSVASAVAAHADCTVVVAGDREPLPVVDPVLLGLDESAHADRAAGFAFDQAAARGVTLHVVRAWMPPPDPWIGSPSVDREEVAVAERVAVGEQVTAWREKFPSVPVNIDVVVGHPYRVLTEAARGAQLVVLGARGRGGLRGPSLGSVTRHLLHQRGATVAVVR
jgi:nucleotide-binding universal stress UspA family protein